MNNCVAAYWRPIHSRSIPIVFYLRLVLIQLVTPVSVDPRGDSTKIQIDDTMIVLSKNLPRVKTRFFVNGIMSTSSFFKIGDCECVSEQ